MLKDFQARKKNAPPTVSSSFLDKSESMQVFLKEQKMISELSKGVQGLGGMIYPSMLQK
jgi:hypothetical protein